MAPALYSPGESINGVLGFVTYAYPFTIRRTSSMLVVAMSTMPLVSWGPKIGSVTLAGWS